MSLNGKIALVAIACLPISPLLILLSPLAVYQRVRARRRAREQGFRQLDTTMIACLKACVDAMVRDDNEDAAERAVRNMDRFLDLSFSSRTWRTKALVLALEHAPRTRFQAPFSRMNSLQRRRFVDRHLTSTRGLFGVMSLLRQLVRLGYYAEEDVQRGIGFVPLSERAKLRRGKAAFQV